MVRAKQCPDHKQQADIGDADYEVIEGSARLGIHSNPPVHMNSSSALAICSAVGGQPITQRLVPLQHLPMPRSSKVLPHHPWPM